MLINNKDAARVYTRIKVGPEPVSYDDIVMSLMPDKAKESPEVAVEIDGALDGLKTNGYVLGDMQHGYTTTGETPNEGNFV